MWVRSANLVPAPRKNGGPFRGLLGDDGRSGLLGKAWGKRIAPLHHLRPHGPPLVLSERLFREVRHLVWVGAQVVELLPAPHVQHVLPVGAPEPAVIRSTVGHFAPVRML